MSDCPSDRTIERLGAGGLGEATFAGLEEHVEACPRCQQALQAAVGDDLRGSGQRALPDGDELPPIPGFHVERELGRGSNGAVFLGKDARTGRSVALKIVPTVERPGVDPRRLTEEAVISKLRHPNILQLYYVIEVGARTVLVLEFIPGGSLKDRLSAPLPPNEAAQVLLTIAGAIAHVHRQGLLHLDIKPSNVLVDAEPGCPLAAAHLKVSDFGISLPLADSVAGPAGPRAIRGTPSYMAPEQAGAIDAPVGPATDVYAVGALLYHMLTGRTAFPAASISEALTQIGTVEPVPPGRLQPGIPKDLEAICLRCLEKQPGRRYASADSLADDLRRFLDGRRISIRPASLEQLGRWCRRRPAIAGLAFTLLCTTIASIGALAYLLHDARTERALAIAAREKAEQNEAIASRTLEELDVWVQRILAQPRLLEGEYLPSLVDDVQLLTEQLHTDQESVLRMTATVSLLERHLARNLQFARDRNGLPEAAVLLTRSRRHLADCLSRKADAPVLQEQYMLTLLDCAGVANSLEDYDQLAAYVAEVASLAPKIAPGSLRIRALCQVSRLRRRTAFAFRINSDPDAARNLMLTNLKMLRDLSREDSEAADLRLQTALTLSWLGRTEEAIPTLRALRALPPSDWLSVQDAEHQVHDWLANLVAERILWTRSAGPERPDVESEGRLLIDLIRSRAAAIGAGAPDLAAVGTATWSLIQYGCGAERRQNRVESEFSSAERFLAFVRQLAVADPGRANSYLLLAQAHHQLAKNAWHFDDDRAALAAMHEAIGAARRAEELAPDKTEPRWLVADLERRVAKSEAAMQGSD